MKRSKLRTASIDGTIAIRPSGAQRITSRIGRSGTLQRSSSRHWIELRQSVEGHIWKAVRRPVLPHCPKVAVERTIFLSDKNNMVYALERRGFRRQRFQALASRHRHDQEESHWQCPDVGKTTHGSLYPPCEVSTMRRKGDRLAGSRNPYGLP